MPVLLTQNLRFEAYLSYWARASCIFSFQGYYHRNARIFLSIDCYRRHLRILSLTDIALKKQNHSKVQLQFLSRVMAYTSKTKLINPLFTKIDTTQKNYTP